MSVNIFLPKDIKAIKAKYPEERLIKPDFTKVKKNKNSTQPTYYIPLGLKGLDGKFKPITLKFIRQLIMSNAKIAHGVTEEDARDVRISFRKVEKKDLEGTDYPETSHQALIDANAEFCDALNIIADEYIAAVNEDILTYKGDKFKLNKTKTINCFRQSERKANDGEESDENGMIPLTPPIFRIKVTADPVSKKLGYNSDKTGHVYTVFDAKRSSKDAKEKNSKTSKPVVARIKTRSGYQDLTISNAKHFITYMSLVGGTIFFDSICISKSGVSLMCKFNQLHVWGHKPLVNPTMNDEDLADMEAFGTTTEETIVDLDEPNEDDQPKQKPAAKKPALARARQSKAIANALDDDAEVTLDDSDDAEPASNDVEDPDEADLEYKTPTKQATPPKIKNKTKESPTDDPVGDNDDFTDEPPTEEQKKPVKKVVKTNLMKAGTRKKPV